MSLFLIGALAFPWAVRAQNAPTAGPVRWGVMAGGENVTGSFKDAFKPGIVFGGEVQFPLHMNRLALRADVMYHWIGEYAYVCIEQGCIDQGAHSHLVTGSLDLIARLNDPSTRWSPYAILGAAVNITGNSDEAIVSYKPKGNGLQGGVGFEVRPWKTTVFVEVRYMAVSPGGVVPVTIGMRF